MSEVLITLENVYRDEKRIEITPKQELLKRVIKITYSFIMNSFQGQKNKNKIIFDLMFDIISYDISKNRS